MAVDTYTARAKQLTARAAEKYGSAAMAPGGDPTRDVVDYCMNELAGIERYADMIRERLKLLGICLSAERVAMINRRLDWMVDDAKRHFKNLETIGNIAREAGIDLGKAEVI